MLAYTDNPVDGFEGTLLWAKLVILFTTDVVLLQLVVSFQDISVDPKVNTASTMNIELAVMNVSIPHEGAEPCAEGIYSFLNCF